MNTFSIEEVQAISQVVGLIQLGKTNYDRTCGFEMWRALNEKNAFDVRRILFRRAYGLDRPRLLFSEE